MAENKCPQCGAPIDPNATECKYCGEKLVHQQVSQSQPQPQPTYIVEQRPIPQPQTGQNYVSAISPAWPIKNKTTAGLLAIFLGGFGIHKFYLGKIGMGILYLLFCWTYIPSIVGFIEGIIYLCSNDENFQLKNHVRLR